MEKTLTLTLTLLNDTAFRADFLEPESGDTASIVCRDEPKVGIVDGGTGILDEVYSWVSLMRDELKESSTGQEETQSCTEAGLTLMQELLDAGYPREEMFSHESDLYVYVTPLTKRIVEGYYKRKGWSRTLCAPIFRSATDGKPMYDCAFAYDEWWNEKCGGLIIES